MAVVAACGAWLPAQQPSPVLGRYETSEGHTMVMLRGTVVFRMGSPESEAGRGSDESLHDVRIPRRFAVATTEVTRAQWSVEDDVLIVADDVLRVRRGGSFIYEAAIMRSAERGADGYSPAQTRDNVGFRVARTLPE